MLSADAFWQPYAEMAIFMTLLLVTLVWCLSGSSQEGLRGEPDSASRSGPPNVEQAEKPETTQNGKALLLSRFADAMQREPSGSLPQPGQDRRPQSPHRDSSPERRNSLLPLEKVNGAREGSAALTASRSSGGLSLLDPGNSAFAQC